MKKPKYRAQVQNLRIGEIIEVGNWYERQEVTFKGGSLEKKK